MSLFAGEHLAALERERDRLEALLDGDPSWRALCGLPADDGSDRAGACAREAERARLEAALDANRIYRVRRKLVEAIEILGGTDGAAAPGAPAEAAPGPPATSGGGIADRIVLIDTPGEALRTRVEVEPGALQSPARPEHARAGGPEASAAAILLALASAARASASGGRAPVGKGGVATAPSSPRPGLPTSVAVDRLELIRGIDAGLAARLHQLGVRRFADIAAWTAADIARLERPLGDLAARIHAECWIEQAAVLAADRETRHAARMRRGEWTALVTPPAEPTLEPATIARVEGLPAPAIPAPVEGRNGATPHLDLADALERVAEASMQVAESDPSIRLIARLARRGDASSIEAVPAPAASRGAHSAPPLLPPPLPEPREAPAGPESESVLELDVGEADVAIARGGAAPGSGTQSGSRRADPARSSGFDGDSYAGYRCRIEEASVEIVRPLDPEGQLDVDQATAGSGERMSIASRFLKALGE
jgi:predicted flap endonuclease-1-like 5' DNA nuclease